MTVFLFHGLEALHDNNIMLNMTRIKTVKKHVLGSFKVSVFSMPDHYVYEG